MDGKIPAAAVTAQPPPASDEAEWLSRLRQGDAQAFGHIYSRYRVRIYSFLLRLCGRRDEADDLLQDTFVQLARHGKDLRPDTQLAPWLYTVARNRYRSQRRTTLSRLEQLRSFFLGARQTPSDLLPGPQQQASERQAVAQLEQAIQTLSPKLREVILLVAVEDLDQDQAALVLGIQPAALRKRLERGRAQLQVALLQRERGADHGTD